MEMDDIKNLWQEHQEKLDKSLSLNKQVLGQLKLDRTRSKMRSLLIYRSVELFIFLILLIALWGFAANHMELPAPAISAAILGLFSLLGLIGSIGQVALIGMIDYSKRVTDIQHQLARVQTHSIQVLRVILLSIPFYLSYIFLGFYFIFGIDLYPVADPLWLKLHLASSVLLTFPVGWLYQELRPGKVSSPWVEKLVSILGPGQIKEAMRLLNEVEVFKSEEN